MMIPLHASSVAIDPAQTGRWSAGRVAGSWVLATLGLALLAPLAQAQSWPARPLRMIVPFGAGGASDFVARIIAPRLQDNLGQPVVVENRAGAGGNLGLETAARAAPDGYAVFLGNVGTLAVNPHVFGASLKVDPLRDLAPVGLVSDTTTMLLVHPSLPVRSVKELIAFARARPGENGIFPCGRAPWPTLTSGPSGSRRTKTKITPNGSARSL